MLLAKDTKDVLVIGPMAYSAKPNRSIGGLGTRTRAAT